MRAFLQHLMAFFILTVVPGLYPALAQTPNMDVDLLTGDTRLACEALLCLSSGKRPDECDPALSRYFGINKKKLSDTLDARRDFLKQCPASNDSKEMSDLVQAISNGAGRCDAKYLNSTLAVSTGHGGDYGSGPTYISNQMPSYCTLYVGNAYTDLGDTLPRYVGTPEKGGYWVEAKDYDSELAKYEQALADRQAQQESSSGGN